MGGDNLKTITYSGAGWSSRIGQTYGLNEDWPKYEVANYTRVVDYDAKWSREDFDRRQGNYPTLGGAPMAPLAHDADPERHVRLGHERETRLRLCPRPYLDGVPFGDLRQLELALTPHGALKAGLAATNATAITLPIVGASDFGLSQFGRKVTIVSFSHSRQVQDERDDQRSEPGGARGHVVPEPGVRRHGLRDALHEVPGLRRREVSGTGPRPPGRSAVEPGAQLLRAEHHQREGQRARPDDAGAGCGEARRSRRR